MAKSKADWVVAGGKLGEVGHCTRCGEGLRMEMPQHIGVVAAAMKAFVDVHKNCRSRSFKEPVVRSYDDWLNGRDTGTSSKTIFAVMLNRGMDRYDVPHDPDDFGRCYRLLKLFPEWKTRLGEVAQRFPEWTPFVGAWATLTQMYERELKTEDKEYPMYHLMKRLEKEGKSKLQPDL